MGYDKNSPMWENDPAVCREADPNWDSKVEQHGFLLYMDAGTFPEQAYPRDIDKRNRYIAFLKEQGSDLADQ